MSDPLFRFHMRYVNRHDDPYFHTRWDQAVPAQVLGANQEQARVKLLQVLGEPGDHRKWAIAIDQIEELLPPAEGDDR